MLAHSDKVFQSLFANLTDMLATTTRLCLTCTKMLRGRSDKKFCDDFCRNNYNNQLKAETNNLVRNVNNALGKNRRILQSLIPDSEEMGKVSKDRLLEEGFQFKYFTNMYTNKKGTNYYFCYEYGYLPLENDWYLIVMKRKE